MATNLSQGSSHISGRPLTNSKYEHFAHLVLLCYKILN